MQQSNYSYCKVFVQEFETETVMAIVTTLLGGRFERHYMSLAGLVVEVRRNSDASGSADPDEDFIHWPVLVELWPEQQEGEQIIVETTAKILHALWNAGHPAVAACDFEEELPWSGGIQRSR